MSSTKKRIIQASKRVLLRDRHIFSMRKVADELSMSLGNLQYHYRTKNQLLQALLTSYIDDYNDLLNKILSENIKKEKESLSIYLKALLKNESEKEVDDIEQIFVLLSSTGHITDDIRKEYYIRVSNMLYKFLHYISEIPKPEKIDIAISILFPFLDSYPFMQKHLKATTNDVVETLSDAIWEIIS